MEGVTNELPVNRLFPFGALNHVIVSAALAESETLPGPQRLAEVTAGAFETG
jgi:hypothetical protein